MTFFESVKRCFANYATFTGRASRPEYWYFSLFLFLAYVAGFLASAVLEKGVWLFLLTIGGLLLPSLAVSARRLRDGGFSPWLLLLHLVPYLGSLVLLILYCMPTRNAPAVNVALSGLPAGYCPQCGQARVADQRYCAVCGAAL